MPLYSTYPHLLLFDGLDQHAVVQWRHLEAGGWGTALSECAAAACSGMPCPSLQPCTSRLTLFMSRKAFSAVTPARTDTAARREVETAREELALESDRIFSAMTSCQRG